MKKQKFFCITFKLLLFSFLVALISYASFIMAIIALYDDNVILLLTVVGLVLLNIPLLIISIFVRRIKLEQKVWLWSGLVALVLVPNIINWAYIRYDKSFIRIGETHLEIYDYLPFVDGTKAVYLDEPSTLILTDSLPKLDGARALYPLYSAFAQAVYPRKTYDFESEVGYTNTINAYDRLINRDVDIIFVASPSIEQ